MLLCFKLSIPNNNAWNGQWSNASKNYTIVRRIYKSEEEMAKTALESGSFYYNFGDGWGASVSVKSVDSAEASAIRRKSDGFCGYDWMVESIIDNGEIIC